VTSGIELAVGLFFVLLAWRIWRGRPERGEAPELPRWMQTIDSFTALKSLGSGAALSALNPKTLTLTIAAAAAIGDAGLSAGREAGVLATFVLLGSLSILVPLALYLRLGERAKDLLERLKAWVAQHGAFVGAAVLLVLAAKLIGDAIVGFSS
jgi:threonine/homoserine/homoserine lactone efflux protein